jgi:hypothetical protein
MKILGRICAILLIAIIGPLFTFAACNFALYQTMLNPATYQDAFSNPAIFDDLLPIALPGIIEAAHQEELNITELPVSFAEVITTLDDDEWRAIATDLVPPAWLKAQFEQALNFFLSISNGDYSVLNNPIDLRDVQAKLTGDNAAQIAQRIIVAAPNCTPEQLTQLNTLTSTNTGQLPICNPEDEALRRQSIQIVGQSLAALATMLPAEAISAGEFYNIDARNAEMVASWFKLDAQIMGLLYLCPAGLVALIVFFTVRSLKSFGRWVGVTGLVTGVFLLLTLALMQFFAIGVISEVLRASNDAERFFGQLLTGIVRAGLAQSSGTLLVQAGSFLLAGFVLLAMSFIVRGSTDAFQEAGSVLITEDGEIISTASRQRSSRIIRTSDDS